MTMSYKFQFQSRGTIDDGVRKHHVLIRTEYPANMPSDLSVDCDIIGTGDEIAETRRFVSNLRGSDILVRNIDEDCRDLYLRAASIRQMDEMRAIIAADELLIGSFDHTATERTDWEFIAHLTPSDLFEFNIIESPRWDGSIGVERPGNHAIEFNHGDHARRIDQHFDFHRDRNAGSNVTVRTQASIVSGDLILSPGRCLREVHEELKRELQTVCAVLSLCFRTPINFYQIAYLEHQPDSGQVPPSTGRARSQQRLRELKPRHSRLIDAEHLGGSGFQRLMDTWKRQEKDSRLERAVTFLAASHVEELLETSFVLGFAALELATEVCSEGSPPRIPGETMRKIKSVLDDLACDANHAEAAKIAKMKLSELRRPPIADKVIGTALRLGIDTDRLCQSPFDSMIRQATKIRNDLVHSALVDDPQAVQVAGIRIRALTERLLLHHLGWSHQDLAWRHDESLSWVYYVE